MNMATCWALTRKRHKLTGIMHNKEVQAVVWAPSKSLVSPGFVPQLDKRWSRHPVWGHWRTHSQGAFQARLHVPGLLGALRAP